MATPTISRPKGYYFEVEAGKRYLWCSCGRSATQPFCDGASHVGTGFLPMLVKARRDEDVIFCGCKHTCTPPFCDGAHNNLEGGYAAEDPDSEANRAVATVAGGHGPVRRLDGECFVFSPEQAELRGHGSLRYVPVVSPALGALFQSQFYIEGAPGPSPVISADGRHTVLFLMNGEGEVEIGDRRFKASRYSGVYIRPGEAYRLVNTTDEPMKVFVSNGPGSEDLVFLDAMPAAFEQDAPHRLVEIDPDQRNGMGDRFFQMLVHKPHGSEVVTQFIGNIPLSKGEPHRHLYEEALIFLHGEGVVWTEKTKTPVRAGEVLFLPRKQMHSVQCVSEGGLDVVGVIYPGDNPSINY